METANVEDKYIENTQFKIVNVLSNYHDIPQKLEYYAMEIVGKQFKQHKVET